MKQIVAGLAILLTSCDFSGPYADLEHTFPAQNRLTSARIPSRTIVLISRRHRGAYNLRDNTEIRLAEHAIEFNPDVPWLKPVRIPATAVSACTESSFGGDNWDADLLVDDVEAQISVHASPEVINWCWRNQIPPASGEETRNWLYNGRAFPPRAAYQQYFASRSAYDERLNQARIGY